MHKHLAHGVRLPAPAAFGATAPSCLADLDDDGQDEVVFYYPVCAGQEFHGVE
jgi:hypothetical protein